MNTGLGEGTLDRGDPLLAYLSANASDRVHTIDEEQADQAFAGVNAHTPIDPNSR